MALTSKPLGHSDDSGFEFIQELLNGDPTAAINFDRLQKHPKFGYQIFELLLCAESQPRVTPWTSHPNKYWHKNSRKFISLFEAAKALDAQLYLVNYAKRGTKHEDEVRLIKVLEIDPSCGITKQESKNLSRSEFAEWFRNLNKECL